MRKQSTLALFATLLVGIALSCSDDEGSKVTDLPDTAGTSSGGGSGGSGGKGGGTSKAAGSNAGGEAEVPGPIPTEACMGLPIDLSGDADGGAASTSGGAPAGGAEPSEPAGGGAGENEAQGGAGGQGAEACNGVSVEAEAVPVDLFVMMDRSQSMGFPVEGSDMTRWEALRDAVQSFVEDAGAAEIRAGIGFFSRSGVANDELDCDADQYAEPSVAIGLLSEVGPDLVAAMDDITPAGLTPTVPALEGAISYARAWAADNPERATLVVLVSDGFPTQCSAAPDQIARAAQDGYESPENIRTFVIGVGDVARFNLDNYARAGGTRKAFLTDAGDVTSSFIDALNNITDSKLACEYRLPPPPDGMKLDTDKVQVIYTPASGSPEEVPHVTSMAACAGSSNGGWYYDNPADPGRISVCPCTCARFQAGQVEVRLGCKPRLGLR